MFPSSVLPAGVPRRMIFNHNGIVGFVGTRQCYIGVPSSHPWYGTVDDYSSPDSKEFPGVHGGVTWSSKEFPGDPGEDVPDGKFWIGWDYNHFPNSASMSTGKSYGITPTFEMLRDELLMVYNVAISDDGGDGDKDGSDGDKDGSDKDDDDA